MAWPDLGNMNIYYLKECEADPECKKGDVSELLSKCRAGLVDYQANVNTMDILKFAADLKNENEFMNGLQKQLTPWMDEGEKITNVNLEKPKSFDEARATEKKCVLFAKDVRKANKLMGKIDESAKRLARYQTTAEQQIEEQVTI